MPFLNRSTQLDQRGRGTRRRLAVALLGLLATIAVVASACTNHGSNAPALTPYLGAEAAATATSVAANQALTGATTTGQIPPGFDSVIKAYQILHNGFVDPSKVTSAALSQAAIEGMVKSVNDRWTEYIPPSQYKIEKADLKGEISGIGAEVAPTQDKQRIQIISTLPGSPAEKDGIRSGDIIMSVNGADTKGWTLTDAVNKIRGPKGSSVTLGILHENATSTVSITVVRETIQTQVVFTSVVSGTDYGLLRISSFTSNVAPQVQSALKKLQSEHVKGIILDLRDNPGGYLDQVVDIASQFLKSGLVTYEIDAHNKRTDWKVRPGGIAQDIPLVVLVDHYSASGSEVLSAALKDHKRAVLIGQTTYGKGSVNTITDLPNGGGLKITIAHWYTPNGNLIEGKGVQPNIQISASSTAASSTSATSTPSGTSPQDPWIAEAIKVLNQQVAQTSTVR